MPVPLGPRARVLGRGALSTSLRIVPLSLVAKARRHHVLAGLLRHRSISGLREVTISANPPITLVAVDSLLLRHLYWYGIRALEDFEVDWWERLCQSASKILEIGANIGLYTVLGSRAAPSVPYTAVDANPEAVRIAASNLGLNHLTDVRLINAAVTDTEGSSVELALPDLERYSAPTGAFLTGGAEGVGKRRRVRETLTVPTHSAATLAEGVDLLKLDVEGSEHMILRQCLPRLVDNRGTLLVEVLRDTPKLRRTLAGLAAHRYKFMLVSRPHLQEITASQVRSSDFFRTWGTRDVAAVPSERVAALQAAADA